MSLHPVQAQFVASRELRRGYCGGRGSGKSFVASYDLIKKAKAGRLYMVASQSYPMLKDATFRSFMHVGGERMNRIIKYRGSGGNLWAKIATFDPHSMPSYGTAEVIFRTASDPDRLRGPNLSGVWLDEASVMKREAYEIATATLREGGEAGWVTLTFTPKGKSHWTYDAFYDKSGKLLPYTAIFHSKQTDNPMLAEEYIRFMKTQYADGSRLAKQELGGEFMDYDGMMFRREWFGLVREVPLDAYRIRYWDKAATSTKSDGTNDGDACFTVGTLMARTLDNKFYIEDVVRGQWSWAERNKVMKQTAEIDAQKYGNTVTIWIEQEPGSGGKESAQISVAELSGYPVFLDRPQDDKITRAIPFSAQCEIENVKLKAALWNEDWLSEAQSFPEGKNKDQVDSATGAFNKLSLNGISVRQVDSMLVYPFQKQTQDLYIESIVNPRRFEPSTTRTPATASLLNYLTRRS